jgi:hypothetical protein
VYRISKRKKRPRPTKRPVEPNKEEEDIVAECFFKDGDSFIIPVCSSLITRDVNYRQSAAEDCQVRTVCCIHDEGRKRNAATFHAE